MRTLHFDSPKFFSFKDVVCYHVAERMLSFSKTVKIQMFKNLFEKTRFFRDQILEIYSSQWFLENCRTFLAILSNVTVTWQNVRISWIQ